jgi:hypothetical protein
VAWSVCPPEGLCGMDVLTKQIRLKIKRPVLWRGRFARRKALCVCVCGVWVWWYYVCMYVCMYACMYVCMYVCMYIYVYICFNRFHALEARLIIGTKFFFHSFFIFMFLIDLFFHTQVKRIDKFTARRDIVDSIFMFFTLFFFTGQAH